jgi:hypothetical protein
MDFDYIVSERTSGANPFQIWEAIHKLHTPQMAAVLRRMPYAQFLRTAYWFAVSHVAKARAGMRCQVSNSSEKITVHHRTYENHGSEHLFMNDLTVLCENCHGLFHGHMEPRPVDRKQKSPKPRRVRVIEHTQAEITVPSGDVFILNQELLNACMTVAGGFTNATIKALGVPIPLRSGWTKRLIGTVVTRENYQRAVQGKFIYGDKLFSRKAA